MKSVLAIIVAYEHPEALERCVGSLLGQTHPTNIVVMDNSEVVPPWNVFATLGRNPGVNCSIIHERSERNLMWTPALNRAIENYGGEFDYVLTLNHDVTLLSNTVQNLVKAFEELPEHAGAVGPTGHGLGGLQGASVPKNAPRERVNYLIGACTMFKMEVFDKVGLFDEKMPLSGDDFDMALRLREAGYSLWVDETDHIDHISHITRHSKNWDGPAKRSWDWFNKKYENYFKDADEARACLWEDARYNDEYPVGTGLSNEEKRKRGIIQ